LPLRNCHFAFVQCAARAKQLPDGQVLGGGVPRGRNVNAPMKGPKPWIRRQGSKAAVAVAVAHMQQ
jgi:hypothetical protein